LHRRLVRVVDWLDERGVVRLSEHYNRFGALYARTAFNAAGKKVNCAYFNAAGQEIIVENYVTGDIILNEDQVRIFHTKTAFVCYFLRRAGLSDRRIFFNSLSTPFFVSEQIGGDCREDVLFWQEPRRKDIPGNMQIILSGKARRTKKILVQKQGACEALLTLGANPAMLQPLGFCYPFARENRRGRDVLICTNSERVACCHKIVKALPELHFHIAALTEMSAKLMMVGAYDNVTLYPGVKMDILDELFDRCDLYLDINYETEIVSAVYRAFLQNQLILAFHETLHNADYVPVDHRYGVEQADRMIADIKTIAADEVLLAYHLKEQREFALTEEPEAYREVL
jgi:accessory Sec system glycosyltransferase GtfB